MSQSAADRRKEPLAVVLPVHNAADRLDAVVGGWLAYLDKLGRPFELVVVDDGSTDATPDRLTALAKKHPRVRPIRHDRHRGFGAALRTALAAIDQPLVFYTAADYPYTPADLGKLLERLGNKETIFDREMEVVIVSGFRMGRAVPAFWKGVGFAFRWFCRIALGLKLDPLPGWLGLREHVRSWFVHFVFGSPLTDVNSAFKLFRRSVFDRFPIQSDGDFVHAEVIAKATFTTSLMDELHLTPRPEAPPRTRWDDWWLVLSDARFTPPGLHPPAETRPPAVAVAVPTSEQPA